MNCNIFEIFKYEPKEPFSLNMQMTGKNLGTKHIFENLKGLYAKGLLIQNGEKVNPTVNKIEINKVTKPHMDKMKRHMLSLGIDVKYRTYSEENKDCLYRDLLHDIQHIKGIKIKTTLDWKKNIIEQINISFDKKSFLDYRLRFVRRIDKSAKINYQLVVSKKYENIFISVSLMNDMMKNEKQYNFGIGLVL